MPVQTEKPGTSHPVLLSFDGSDDAAAAIAHAGEVLGPRSAVVLTVWEPVAVREPYDPATILSAPLSRLGSHALGLGEASGPDRSATACKRY